MDQIKINLPETEILSQLAEEAAELAQAALKLRRAIDKRNPTPMSEGRARASLYEEYGDVLNCMDQLRTDYWMENAELVRREKMRRWVEGLEGNR